MNARSTNFQALSGGFSPRGRGGFTLIEIMVVVAIMGIILTIGIPPMARSVQKTGMAKALTDLFSACQAARQEAVIKQTRCEVVIHPQDGAIQAPGFTGQIPPNVTLLSVGVNFIEFNASEEARASFYPNGTSDEFSVTIQGENGEVRQVYLDIVTGTPEVKDM